MVKLLNPNPEIDVLIMTSFEISVSKEAPVGTFISKTNKYQIVERTKKTEYAELKVLKYFLSYFAFVFSLFP